jgi:hypothetical protein
MGGGDSLNPQFTRNAQRREYRPPRHAAIGPCAITCPSCDAGLSFALRVTLESARQAAKRRYLPEAFLVCPHCHRQWVAGLWLAPTAFSGEGVRR